MTGAADVGAGAGGAPCRRGRGLAFGGWAQLYDRARPGYPVEAVRWLVGVDDAGGADVVDLGAGTGRLAEVVARLGHAVLAVEPDEAMRAVAERALPGRTWVGAAEDTGLGDACADVVLVGQAFHWFDRGRAVPEIARVLRPHGHLGVVWNVRDERVDWVRQFLLIVGGQDRRSAMRAALDDLAGHFGPVDDATFGHAQTLDAEGLVALAGSYSYVALRVDRDEVLAQVRRLAGRHPDLAGREQFELPYLTMCFRAGRATGGGPH